MKDKKIYDCAIIGGGLAGLSLSIQLAKMNHKVILYEKNQYPFHKVCGEYISMESWDFIESLGLPLSKMNLPKIDTLHISAENGFQISSKLSLGGFGISRFTLENELAKIAVNSGVVLKENSKVNHVDLKNEIYQIQTNSDVYFAKIVCGSYGKINPIFIEKQPKKNKQNFIGVKYHIKTDFPSNLIELHNFKDGYAGISKIENNQYCLCYLTTSENLKQNNNDIKTLEKNVLFKNPYLKKYFETSEFLFEKPLTISQISFHSKKTYINEMLIIGDAAGAIAPLCGNGMSMAMKSSKLLANQLNSYFLNKLNSCDGKISKKELIENYHENWNLNFSKRINIGYYLQFLFGRNLLTLLTLKLLLKSPKLFRKIISFTHGERY